MLKFYLVQAVNRSRFGLSKSKHRVVVAKDAIEAARNCFDDLPKSAKTPGQKFPEYFKVWAERDRTTFMAEVGALTVHDNDDDGEGGSPLDAIIDVFEATPQEVRL